MTKEHWISRSILEAMVFNGLPPLVSGLSWLGGGQKAIPPAVLCARVLCKRHNGALSPLDADAAVVFKALHRYQDDLALKNAREGSEFILLSGTRFELWLVKLALGGVASKSFGGESSPVPGLRAPANFENLVEVLFRGADWPSGWGFHAFTRDIDPRAARVGLSIDPLVDANNYLSGIRLNMGVVGLDLALEAPHASMGHRPGGLALYRKHQPVEKAVAFAWREHGHRPIVYRRAG